MKTTALYCRVDEKGSPRGVSPLSPIFPFPYHKGKGIKGIGSPDKTSRGRGSY